jgi:nucleoside-diphosphate-sugar epimerase
MKLLVTGGLGFTGSRLVEYLLERGHEITVLDTQKGLFYDALREKGVRILLGSVVDREAVSKSLEDVEGVFHLAAAFRKINESKRNYLEVNAGGTRILCEECLKRSVRKFVYCSTQGVHGNIQNPPGDEESPIAPEDYYQVTKYEGEKVVAEFAEKGLPTVILRPMAIYGPGDPGRFLHLFRMAKSGRFLMFGDGGAFYHPLYVDNLSDAFLKAFESDKRSAETYLIGDDEYFTIKELVRKVGASIGVDVRFIHLPFAPLYWAACLCEFICVPLRISPPLFRRRADWFRQNRAFKIDKAKNELGYEPRVGIDEGLKRTGAWYRENGYL